MPSPRFPGRGNPVSGQHRWARQLRRAQTPPGWGRSERAGPPDGIVGLSTSQPVGASHLEAVLATAALSPAARVEQVGTDGTGRTRWTPPHKWKVWGGTVYGLIGGKGGAGGWEEGKRGCPISLRVRGPAPGGCLWR